MRKSTLNPINNSALKIKFKRLKTWRSDLHRYSLYIVNHHILGETAMARANQETVTTFGEVLHSANISYSQNRTNTPDNRLMIYFQGMQHWGRG